MNVLWHNWLGGNWANVVAISLAHFLWQGVLVGLVALSLNRLLRKASASSRYVLQLVALISLPVCFVLTLAIVEGTERKLEAAVATVFMNNTKVAARSAADASPSEQSKNELSTAGDRRPLLGNADAIGSALSDVGDVQHRQSATTEASDRGPGESIVARNEQAWLPRLAPLIVAFYLFGVATFFMRLTLAIRGGHRLRKASQPINDSKLLGIVADQARRVGLRIVPVVAFCERVAVPTVVGVVRPMVLLPASLIAGLAPEQFAAIISHELVHIRRYDLLVNLLQRVIESLLFFHPVVWYLSRSISREREVCCDDLVVISGYEPMDYAGALLRMAELCAAANPSSPIAAAATGNNPSDFESRVTRLMTMTRQTQLRLTRAGAILLGLLLIPLIIVPSLIVGVVQAEESQDAEQINGTLQFQMAVRTPGPMSNEDVNAGKWQVAVEWKVPIRSDGGSGK
ncbi:MAG: M56 family metallopeptidase [Pirellulaceae bacterium]